MPIKRKAGLPATAPPAEPSFLDRIGGLPGLAAGGVRALTGAASAEGFVPGAVISGLGELGAEALEGSLFKQDPFRTLSRVGAAGAIGAVPFGAVLKAGRPLASAVRGAAYSGGGEALREAAAGQEVDPGTVLGSAATGGALTGGLSALMKMFGMGGAAAGTTKAPSVSKTPYGPKTAREVAQETVAQRTARLPADVKRGAERSQEQFEIQLSKKNVKYETARNAAKAQAEKDTLKNLERFLAGKKKEAAATAKKAEQAAKEATRQAAEDRRLAVIKEAIEAGQLQPGKPAIATSLSAPTEEGGRLSMRTPFRAPKTDADDVGDVLPTSPTAPAPTVDPNTPAWQAATAAEAPSAVFAYKDPISGLDYYHVVGGASDKSTVSATSLAQLGIPVPEAPVAAATHAAESASPLARFFKSRLEAAGEGYGAVKAAKVAGEAVPEEGRRLAGKLAQQERIAAGVPAPPRAPKIVVPEATVPTARYDTEEELNELSQLLKAQPQAPPVAPAVPAAAPKPVTPGVPDEAALIKAGLTPDEIAAIKGSTPKGPRLVKKGAKRGSETGEVNPLMLARFGLGAGGALLGAATDPLDNPLASAFAGGVAGASLPSAVSLLRNMGAPPAALEGIEQAVQSPEGIRAAAKRIYHSLPQVQRFNYLFSGEGLPANMLAGPYGSALMAGLEHGLAGDPRGWKLVRSLNPVEFAKEFYASADEAAELIARGELGRAENIAADMTRPLHKRFLSVPAQGMTMGDVAARKLIERAGFSPDEARRFTLTSEPELPAAKTMANIGKGSTLLNILLPFRRTPANIAEQGFERLPGIGSVVQSMRETPDPLKQQLVQQLLSTAVAGGSGTLASQLDPESARFVRRYVTNLGGQYSLPAALGFTAGQAVARGKPAISAQNLRPAIEALPLPSTQPAMDWAKFVLDAEHPVPRGATPGVWKELMDILYPPSAPALPRLQGIPRIRRR